MECVEIIVKIKLYDIIDVLQQKGHELNNLINGIYLMSAAMILLKTSKSSDIDFVAAFAGSLLKT